MAINYNIQAEVVDIRVDTPKQDDSFLVDTNIWFWMAYSRASLGDNPPGKYQITYYPTYISNALNSNSKLYRCGLSLSELAHIIEKTEWEIFKRTGAPLSIKEFRHNLSAERTNVVTQINVAWSQVKSMASPVENLIIDESATDFALNRLSTQMLDGYDLFIVESITKSGLVQVITDDGDYTSVPNIRVFTANRNVIDAARNQGKLVTR
jgi:hypothetical protein